MGDGRSASVVDTRLGQRVRNRRLEIGMSQERLAEIVGVTFQQVQKYERGVNRIAASRLWDIAAALDLPIARLFESIGPTRAKGAPMDNNGGVHQMLATPEGVRLVAVFNSIKSQKLRRRVVELVTALAEEAA